MRPVKIQLVTGGILMAVLVGGMGAAIQSQYTPPEIERGVWNGKEIEFVKGHVILKFKQDKTLVQIEDHLQTNELKLINDPITSRTIVAEFSDSSQTIQKIRRLANSEEYEWVEPNMIFYGQSLWQQVPPVYPQEDPLKFAKQWHLEHTGQIPPGGQPGCDISAPEGWAWTKGGHEYGRPAILDTGIPGGDLLTHPDLNDPNRFLLMEDYVQEMYRLFYDWSGHGTHVLGILASETNNGLGIAGAAWQGEVLVYKVMDQRQFALGSDIASAIHHASNHGAGVINCSIAGPDQSCVREAIQDHPVVLIVAPVGNKGYPVPVEYPAAYSLTEPNVIAVASTDADDYRSPFSNTGLAVSVAAPGGESKSCSPQNIYSTAPGYRVDIKGFGTEEYGYLGGTSMAVPQVSALASLVASINPWMGADGIAYVIEENAEHVHDGETDPLTQEVYDYSGDGHNILVGHGRIDFQATLNAVPISGFHAEIVPLEGGPQKVALTNKPPQTWYAHLSWLVLYNDLFWRYRVDKSENVPGNWHFLGYYEQPQYGNWQMCDDYAVEDWVDYYYRVVVVDELDVPRSGFSQVIHVFAGGGGGPDRSSILSNAPQDLTLDNNFPNPFNPTTQIKFGLPTSTHVRLQIMNIRGQIVQVLVDDERPAGWYTVTWDGKNESGIDVASGIYLYMIEADNKKILKKMTIIR